MSVKVGVAVSVLVTMTIWVTVFVMMDGVRLWVGVEGVPVTVRTVAVGVAVGFASGASERKINPMQ